MKWFNRSRPSNIPSPIIRVDAGMPVFGYEVKKRAGNYGHGPIYDLVGLTIDRDVAAKYAKIPEMQVRYVELELYNGGRLSYPVTVTLHDPLPRS